MRRKMMLKTSALFSLALSVGTITYGSYVRADTVKEQSKSTREKVATLMKQASSLEENMRIDEAIAIYTQVMEQYPKARYEDEVGRGLYSNDARDRLLVLMCKKTGKYEDVGSGMSIDLL